MVAGTAGTHGESKSELCFTATVLENLDDLSYVHKLQSKDILENGYLHSLFSVNQYFVTCLP